MGASYNTYVHFDFSHSIDTKSYIKVSNGDFSVNPVHRYRVIVPLLAKAVSLPFEKVYTKIWSGRTSSTWPLQLGYYIINSILCAVAGLMLYLLCTAYKVNPIWAIIAVTAILTSRWSCYMAGLPLTDSLYLLVIAASFLALKTKNDVLLLFAILIGPFAKESFIFIAPILFFYGHLSWLKKIAAFVIAGALVFGVRYWIDTSNGLETSSGFDKAFDTLNTIKYSLLRIFSFKGAGEIFSVINVFWIIILLGFFNGKKGIKSWGRELDIWLLWLIPSILIHALLSGDIARMLLFGAPVIVVVLGLILEKHPKFESLRSALYKNVTGE